VSIRIENNMHLGGVLPERVTREALQAAADHVKNVAQGKAPLLTGVALHKANDERRANPGELRDSAYSRVLDDTSAEVGFTSFYAGWQHERMDYHHEDGQAKVLEEPLATEKDEVLRIMADKIREGLHS
jgi:hypothetical protein